jgi:hypothetical protein
MPAFGRLLSHPENALFGLSEREFSLLRAWPIESDCQKIWGNAVDLGQLGEYNSVRQIMIRPASPSQEFF